MTTRTEALSGVVIQAYRNGSAVERAKIVAWLRERADTIERRTAFSMDIAKLRAIADEIARGEHDKSGE